MAVKKEIRRTGWREAGGIAMLAFAAMALLSMMSFDPADISLLKSPPNSPPHNFIGPIGAWIAFISFMSLGVVGYVLPVAVAALGFWAIFSEEGRIWVKTLIWCAVLLAGVCLVELSPGLWESLEAKINVGNTGGVIGYLIADRVLIRFIGRIGTGILSVATILVGLVLLFRVQPLHVFSSLTSFSKRIYSKSIEWRDARRDRREQIEREEREIAKKRRRLEEAVAGKELEPVRTTRATVRPEPTPSPVVPEQVLPQPKVNPEVAIEKPADEQVERRSILRRKTKEAISDVQRTATSETMRAPEQSDYVLPGLSLLDDLPPAASREIKGDFQRTAAILKETLAEFGIEAEVTNVEKGPVVTRYEVLPAPGVRVERIANLSNNIGLAMKAESVRVQAPIPGKGVVGIEVPNSKSTIVYLRELMEGDTWKNSKAALPLALGKDVAGNDLVADLAEMPHMLIAGATGSGKTVCMNSLLAGLLMSRTPDQMKLMLIDPKIVEFSVYNHLPHLVVPVITDPKKVVHGLRWAIKEMEERYKLFAQVGVRNIATYNTRPIVKQTDMFGEEGEQDAKRPPDRIPYLAIVIDELADLMMVAQSDIENGIARLAQLSRAVGIHMIIATQRPSVNVITGTIKANLPARIAFQVAQKTDSRTILDANGAEKLLGKGDMLFLPPGTGRLLRAQGTLTSDSEIRGIVDFIKEQGAPQYETAIKDKIESKRADLPELDEDDELLETAVEIIRQTKRASTSSLQRRLRIGYTRAARLMDLLEEKGIVGPPRGSDPREILIDLDGEIPQNESEPVRAD